jgi:quercetin dioxygenase-like cupin family protein
MESTQFFKDYRSFVSFDTNHYGKATLFENEHILIGLNSLEPGQSMEKHAHKNQNRFYLVLEGKGLARVGEEEKEIEPGMVIWIPSGHVHGIKNTCNERMVMLIGFTGHDD